MEFTNRELTAKFEMLQAVMLDLLEADPANGWWWIVEAQRRVLLTQMESVRERKVG